jgi:hypothetical protein
MTFIQSLALFGVLGVAAIGGGAVLLARLCAAVRAPRSP